MLSIETMLTTETFYVTMLTLTSYRATEWGAMAGKCALAGTLSCATHSITFDRYVLCSRQGVTAMLDVQKIALITGANKGIGFEIARQLGAKGIIVLIGVRDQARNVFGVFAVTKAMLPLLRRSDAGRIVNLSSPVGSLSLNSDPKSFYAQMPPLLAYCSSKTAVNAITVFFANELRQTNIKVNAVSPGYVATDLNDHNGFLTPQQGATLPVTFATLPADGPTGGFFEADGGVPW